MASKTANVPEPAEALAQGVAADEILFAIRRISSADLVDSLKRGFDDFWAKPSHVLFIGILYPLIGLFLGNLAIGYDVIPLLFPLFAGLSLVGPFVVIGLYEISRRRELGLDTSWYHAFEVLQSPSRGAILALGLLLLVIYFVWLGCAMTLYQFTIGGRPPDTIAQFVQEVLTTPQGWALIVIGNGIGFVLALAVLVTSVVSFPLILDQHVNAGTAIRTSVEVFLINPGPMIIWGLIVACGLIVGGITLFVGLALIVPILGHATWHLFRKVVQT